MKEESLFWPRFGYVRGDKFILNSHKVMYSTFNQNPRFSKYFWGRKSIKVLVKNHIKNGKGVFFLYRHPEKRFMSYFRDKFRKEPQRILDSECPQNERLQPCHLLWLNLMSEQTDDIADACRTMLKTNCDEVVDHLHEILQKEFGLAEIAHTNRTSASRSDELSEASRAKLGDIYECDYRFFDAAKAIDPNARPGLLNRRMQLGGLVQDNVRLGA